MGAPHSQKAPASEGGRYMVDANGCLPFQEIHFVGEDGFAVAEEGDDDAKADGGFRGGGGNDEEGEDLAGDVSEVTREGNEVDVDGVKDQLDGHEDDNDVAARDDADGADQKQREAQEQVMADGHHGAPVLFLAMTTAPTMATSSSTLAISKGRRYESKRLLASSSVFACS